MTFKSHKKYFCRKVGGDYFLFPDMSAAGSQNGAFITLNETGAFLWQLIDAGETSADALAASLTGEYDVSAKQAAADVASFLEKLRAAEIIS